MYTTKRWIAVKARAKDSCLKIVKGDLLKVAHCVTTSDPYGPRCKRWLPTAYWPSTCEALRQSGLHTANKRKRRSLFITIANLPPQQGDS